MVASSASVKTLRSLEHLLPIKADQLIGQSIDIFHKRPEHQRKLIGDPAKAKRQLGWEPKVRFKELVKIMTEADLELAKREAQIAQLPKP